MIKNEIPKKIHYCWFGDKALSKTELKCIESWKKFFPDYEIIEWNENNYDVYKIKYIKQAYKAKKYAFVSDYARFDILYHEGGIYFDTDVEVVKSFDDILSNGAFMGCERDGISKNSIKYSHDNLNIAVNPGLGLASYPGLYIYKEILDFYLKQSFYNQDGSMNQETVVTKVTRILLEHGMQDINEIQKVEEVYIYPKEFFNPMNNNTGVIEITEKTHSIHRYSMSWISSRKRIISRITRVFHRIFGENCFSFLKK